MLHFHHFLLATLGAKRISGCLLVAVQLAVAIGIKPLDQFLSAGFFVHTATITTAAAPGDRVYLLAKGAVSIVAEDPEARGKHRRVVTLAPGVIFGENAVLEGGTRAVTAIAEDEVVTYSLSHANMDAIYARNPDLYRRIVLNMLGHLSGLLRMASSILRDASETTD